jgi:hypothetical protein
MSYPNDKLWNLFKELKDYNDKDIDVYMVEMTEPYDDRPSTYVVIQNQIYDSAIQFGDGSQLFREASYTIYVNARDYDDLLAAKEAVELVLKENDMSYDISNVPYDSTSTFYSFVFEGNIDYGI